MVMKIINFTYVWNILAISSDSGLNQYIVTLFALQYFTSVYVIDLKRTAVIIIYVNYINTFKSYYNHKIQT